MVPDQLASGAWDDRAGPPERAAAETRERRDTVPEPPTGWARLGWLGPGFLWMVSAAGSGELLFTPRIGALYGYTLLWALLAAVVLKWFINREVGRYAVCRGVPILEGFGALRGPGRWALWFIVVPQLVVAVTTIAGLGSGAATAAQTLLPGGTTLWTIVLILVSTVFVAWGRYGLVEKAATAVALALAVAAIVAAASVLRDPGPLARGLVPTIPDDVDLGEVLPWIGFALSGAAGMIWYSYWLTAKGYGAAGRGGHARGDAAEARADAADDAIAPEDQERLHGWLRQLTLDNTVAVVGTLVVMLGFLVLGTELLKPQGLVPEEDRMARVLGQLLGEVWGRAGFYVMLVGVLVGFWSTVLSDQDGFGRMFANGTRVIARRFGRGGRWVDETFLQRAFVIGLLTALPIGLYLLVGEPVALLQTAGAIEAAHLPVLAGLALYLNRARLPRSLQPSALSFWGTVVAAAFFATFAVLYAYRLLTGRGG